MSVDTPILNPTEQIVPEALRSQLPVKELPGVSIQNVREHLSDHPKPATDYHLKTGQRE